MKIKRAGPYSFSLGYPAKRCTQKGDPRFYCKHGATKHKIRRLLLSNVLMGVPRINISFSLWARRVLPECVLVPVCSWSTFKPICFSRGQKQWSYLQSHWNCCLKHPLHSRTFYCSDLLPFDPASPALDKSTCFESMLKLRIFPLKETLLIILPALSSLSGDESWKDEPQLWIFWR